MGWWSAATAAAALVLAAQGAYAQGEVAGNYEILFGDDFDARLKEKLDGGKNVLMFFMAPWCANCKAFAPEFQAAAKTVEGMQAAGGMSETVFAEIDADNFGEVGSKYEIEAYPTLKWFPAGSDGSTGEPFVATMDMEGIVDFVKKNALQPLTPIQDKAALADFLGAREKVAFKDALVVLGVQNGAAAEARAAVEAARKADEVGMRFAIYESATPLADVAEALGESLNTDAAEGIVAVLSKRHGVKAMALENVVAETIEFLEAAVDIPSDVVELTSDNFQSTLETYEYAVVEFYAPWCGYCQRLAPEYDALAGAVKSAGLDNVLVAKVDVTKEESIGMEYEIEGFPTLKWFRKGSVYDFPNEGEAQAMFAFINKKIGPTFAQELKKASKSDIDAFFQSRAGLRSAAILLPDDTIPEVMDHAAYGAIPAMVISKSTPASTLEAFGIAEAPALVVVNEAGIVSTATKEDEVDFTDAEELTVQLNILSMPTISIFSDEFLDEAIDSGVELIYFIVCEETSSALAAVKDFAKTLSRREALFAHVDPADSEMEYALEFFEVNFAFGVDQVYLRAVNAADLEMGGGIYPFRGPSGETFVSGSALTVDSLQSFAQAIRDKTVEPLPQNEEEFAPDPDGPYRDDSYYDMPDDEQAAPAVEHDVLRDEL